MSEPLLILTGGGTAGHVMPHFALLPFFKERGWKLAYIGSAGMEKDLVRKQGLTYHEIASGKLRRYFSLANFFDLFRIGLGFLQSLLILAKDRPRAVFSKGGFVSVPVCFAAAVLRIPVITHESDLTPGLATKLIDRVAHKTLCTFPETKKWLPHALTVGSPVRTELFLGDRTKGLALCQFSEKDERPTILVMGGSLGAQKINESLKAAFPMLRAKFRIIHLTGRSKTIDIKDPSYVAFEFAGSELADLYAVSDLIVARAGANSIFEFLSLRKPMLLIPLKAGSRGDQVVNAQSFVEQGWARQLAEDSMGEGRLAQEILSLAEHRFDIQQLQSSFDHRHTYQRIIEVLQPFMS